MSEETVVATEQDNLEEYAAARASKSKKAKKAAKKAPAKKSKAGKAAKGKTAGEKKSGGIKKVGVIAVILTCIARPEGASYEEIKKELEKKFKDRDAKGMATTARIQLTRAPKKYGFELKKTKDEKRGLVYKAPTNLVKSLLKDAAEA